ncbi:MAG: DUF2800 domain-containing protein [Defluviitaleaceae bacterium]|nr:DUF2800 domain-containing protein [Defluviitaleaceae bacterium]MCL2837386.1 DUF2800 domain-containing protein [Defluviitaleaceae bacterium]
MVIIGSGTIHVIDLKYGTGVPVSAEWDKQLMLYGLGALVELEPFYDIETVSMTICQPRLDSIKTFMINAAVLTHWAEAELKPAAETAFKGEGTFNPGDHCMFCKAKAECRARAEKMLEMARYEFRDSALLTPDEIPDIIRQADALQRWAKDIQEFALKQAVSGVKYAGFKLVEGYSKRVYTDEAAIIAKLLKSAYAEDTIFKKKLLGITDMEKLIGKKHFPALLGEYVRKPPGKPALVLESDKRPEYVPSPDALTAFDEEIDE